jgi:hypothetical protein
MKRERIIEFFILMSSIFPSDLGSPLADITASAGGEDRKIEDENMRTEKIVNLVLPLA